MVETLAASRRPEQLAGAHLVAVSLHDGLQVEPDAGIVALPQPDPDSGRRRGGAGQIDHFVVGEFLALAVHAGIAGGGVPDGVDGAGDVLRVAVESVRAGLRVFLRDGGTIEADVMELVERGKVPEHLVEDVTGVIDVLDRQRFDDVVEAAVAQRGVRGGPVVRDAIGGSQRGVQPRVQPGLVDEIELNCQTEGLKNARRDLDLVPGPEIELLGRFLGRERHFQTGRGRHFAFDHREAGNETHPRSEPAPGAPKPTPRMPHRLGPP